MKFTLSFAFICLAFTLFAQPKAPAIGRLYGKIVDAATKSPVAYASVTVLRSLPNGKDSLIGGALTLENGDFNIPALPMGAFKVKASFVGNKDLIRMVKISPPNNLEQDLGDLPLAADAQILNTVEVRTEKASTTMSLEKRVFNVEKNITSTGGTAEDVLKNVPSVTVDMDGNPKLRDKSATIYVDGKPTLMALNQIPSDQIESVEVIANPSAKYDASTMGGILNIVLKQNRKAGYNGVLILGAGTQDRYNGMLNLNLNQDRWKVSGFYSGNNANVPTPYTVNRTNMNAAGAIQNYYSLNSTVTYKNLFQVGRLTVDYSVDNRNTVSFAGSIAGGFFNIPVTQDYQFLSAAKERTNYGTRQTLSENYFNRNSVEAQWKKTYATKNKSLVTLFNYSWGNKTNATDWNTTNYDSKGVILANNPELVKMTDANTTNQILFQTDYVNPLNDSTKVEMGVRSFWNIRDQNYFYKPYNYASKTYITDNLYSQDAAVNESINAAYITYSGRWSHQINYQAGLRFEQSNLTGISRLADQPNFGYDYPKGMGKDLLRSFFPSIYISKNLDEQTQVGVNFSRKIQRPNFMQIMPGIKSNDKQNITIGNPALQPEFINLAELNYNKIFGNHNWLASLYLTNETNSIKPFAHLSATDPTVLITTFVNGNNELMYGMDNTLKLAFGKNFDVMLNANIFKFSVSVDTFVNSAWTGTGKVNLTYRLPSNFSVQLNGAYEGNRPQPQGNRQAIAYMDFAVKKSFFNNAANVVFSVNDVFNTRKDISTFVLPTIWQETMRRRDTRYFKLALQIPFGKMDASVFKKGNKRPEGQEMQEY
jgi:outer membrane receptor protein involved in Fe transport